MTWITFTIYLLGGYVTYYALNILFDLVKKPAIQAGEVETLSVSDNVETIEVYDDDYDSDVVFSANNSDEEENNQSNQSEYKLKQEVKKTVEEPDSQIIPSIVEAVISPNGGVDLKSLTEIYRLKAISESNKFPFAS